MFDLGAKTKNKETFCEVIRGILWEKAVVSAFELRCTLEIRDIDSFTVKEKVKRRSCEIYQTWAK